MVFNATFNNISAISLLSVLLVEKMGVPGEKTLTCRKQGRIQRGGAHSARAAHPKIGINMIFFWRKIVIFHTKYPNNFRASLNVNKHKTKTKNKLTKQNTKKSRQRFTKHFCNDGGNFHRNEILSGSVNIRSYRTMFVDDPFTINITVDTNT